MFINSYLGKNQFFQNLNIIPLLILLFLSFSILPTKSFSQEDTISSIIVNGNKRITSETIIAISEIENGALYSPSQLNSALQLIKKSILDQESLFTNTKWGERILKNVEDKVTKLAAENRTIESELEIEELNLTKVRKITAKIEFDILAIEFDKKVKKIRNEQALKQREINNYLNENRKLFFEKITPILLNYIDELGIEVLLNKDTVALASLGSDITQSAINRINEKLDD